ncbi:MAG: hypothetical protein H0W02_00140 [Ktedonobacteraceae bacterium]|nr:hypothetical protein [Ktedonobacteraceae bacterium]
MSSHYSSNSGSGAAGNSGPPMHRRDMRATNGAHSPLPASADRGYPGSFDFETMIASLRELFENDRHVASQSDSARCGVCYLYGYLSDLQYREEGFYVCHDCERTLGRQRVHMIRKQQK